MSSLAKHYGGVGIQEVQCGTHYVLLRGVASVDATNLTRTSSAKLHLSKNAMKKGM